MDIYDKLLQLYSRHVPCNKYQLIIFLNYVREHETPLEEWGQTYVDHQEEILGELDKNLQRIFHSQIKHFIKYRISHYTVQNGRVIEQETPPSFITGRIIHENKQAKPKRRIKPPHNPSKHKRTIRIVDHWSKL